MNGLRLLVVYLGIIAVPIAAFFGIWWIFDSVVGLNPPLPRVIAAATLMLGFVGLFRWLIAVQRKEDEVLVTLEHPFFGLVKQKRKSWEATMNVPNVGSEIAVSSYEGDMPTMNQEEIIRWLSDSIDPIREELEERLDDFARDTSALPSRPRNLVFESVLVDPVEPKTFCLGFDIDGADLPWGFSAFYVDGKLDEFTDNH
ncbi:MAG: hypothetical protein V4584_13740 [Verrucomicrobiota bacterium]